MTMHKWPVRAMEFTASSSDTLRVRADISGLRRFVAAAVTSLLVADLAAVAVVVAADRGPARHRSAAAAAVPTHPMAVITTADGQRLLADPTTPRGELAIREAPDH